MRMRLPDIGAFGRALGLLVVALMLVLATIHLRGGEEQARVCLLAPATSEDPLAAGLARCQALGMTAENDAGCKATWAENRRRFFAPPPSEGTASATAPEPNAAAKAGGH